MTNLIQKLLDCVAPLSAPVQAMSAALMLPGALQMVHDPAFPDRLEFVFAPDQHQTSINLGHSFGTFVRDATLVISPRGARLYSPWFGELPLNWREKRELAAAVSFWIGDGEQTLGEIVEVGA